MGCAAPLPPFGGQKRRSSSADADCSVDARKHPSRGSERESDSQGRKLVSRDELSAGSSLGERIRVLRQRWCLQRHHIRQQRNRDECYREQFPTLHCVLLFYSILNSSLCDSLL